MNSVIPIPTGARNVALCFSTANRKITIKNWVVRNISMNRPCTTDVPASRPKLTSRGPGKRPETTPAAAIPASIWQGKTRRPRIGGTAPMSTRPRVTFIFFSAVVFQEVQMETEIKKVDKRKRHTAGFNMPPLIR